MCIRDSNMTKMPVVFVGHGSPMNAIEDNEYSRSWRSIADRIPRPEVIISDVYKRQVDSLFKWCIYV